MGSNYSRTQSSMWLLKPWLSLPVPSSLFPAPPKTPKQTQKLPNHPIHLRPTPTQHPCSMQIPPPNTITTTLLREMAQNEQKKTKRCKMYLHSSIANPQHTISFILPKQSFWKVTNMLPKQCSQKVTNILLEQPLCKNTNMLPEHVSILTKKFFWKHVSNLPEMFFLKDKIISVSQIHNSRMEARFTPLCPLFLHLHHLPCILLSTMVLGGGICIWPIRINISQM